jgi:nitroreductase
MNSNAKIFDEIVNARRSVRIYDEQAVWDESVVTRSLERALLAPNSSNLQLWEFYRVASPNKKEELAKYCLGQNAAKTANELIVVVARKDKWKERSKFVFNKSKESIPAGDSKRLKLISDYYNKLIPILYNNDPIGLFSSAKKIAVKVKGLSSPTPREVSGKDVDVIVHKSAALAAQTFMLSIKAEGYDSCPMEGFDSERVKQFLKLPNAAEITMIISVGTAKPEGIYGPRVRVPKEEVLFKL